jgi:PAS domain S-box-containing protein
VNRDRTESTDRVTVCEEVYLVGSGEVLERVGRVLERDGTTTSRAARVDPTVATGGRVDCVVIGPGAGGNVGEFLAVLPSATPVVWYADADPDAAPHGVDAFVRRRDDGSDAERVADQVRWLLTDADAERETDDEKIRRLHRAATEMVACRDEETVLERTLAAAERVLEFDICGIYVVEDGRLVPVVVSDEMAEVGYQHGVSIEEGGIAGEAVRTGESFVNDDIHAEEDADPAEDAYRSGLTVPIGELGVFQAAARQVGSFDETDRELVELLVAYTRETIKRIRVESELRERHETIERLHEVTTELVACDDAAQLYDRLVVAAAEVLEFEISVVLTAVDEETLAIRATSESEFAPDVGKRIGADRGIVGETYRTGETMLVSDVDSDAAARPSHEAFESGISVRLGDDGVFQASATEPDAFDETDRELAELLVSQASVALARIRAESDLRAERDRLAALFENVPDPAASVAVDGDRTVVTAVNPAFEAVFGYDAADVVGEDLDDLIVPPSAREQAERVNREFRDGESLHVEGQRTTADGEARDFLLHVVPLEHGAENLLGYVIYTDITERKERERELARQNERLDEFASVVSHDLRNPLNVARGYLDIARRSGDESAFDRVEAAHDRMDDLIDGLLTLARKGDVVGDAEPVALDGVAGRAWESVGNSAERDPDGAAEATGDGLDAAVAVEADATVRADEDRLVQLFENLFRNAVEHGSTSPSSSSTREDAVEHSSTSPRSQAHEDAVDHADEPVQIRVGPLRSDDGELDGFYVADDGPGIPPAERADVLEAGYSTAESGTGLGLAIVNRIVEAHDWSVTVTESEAGGARFEVQI